MSVSERQHAAKSYPRRAMASVRAARHTANIWIWAALPLAD